MSLERICIGRLLQHFADALFIRSERTNVQRYKLLIDGGGGRSPLMEARLFIRYRLAFFDVQ